MHRREALILMICCATLQYHMLTHNISHIYNVLTRMKGLRAAWSRHTGPITRFVVPHVLHERASKPLRERTRRWY
jgi:hypothetical protein